MSVHLSWERRVRVRRYLHHAIWPIPFAFVVAGTVAGIVLPRLERVYFPDAFPMGFGAGAATTLLGSFATGLITVIGLAVSIAIAGLTFGSSSLTPRIIAQWQQSQALRVITGTLLMSVIYAFLVLQEVAPRDDPDFVPDLSVWLVVTLLVVDMFALLILVRVMTRLMRFADVLDDLHRRGRRVVETLYPDELNEGEVGAVQPTPTEPARVVYGERAGVVASIDSHAIATEATRLGITIELVPVVGEYVGLGTPFFRVWPADVALGTKALEHTVAVSDERTITQDPLFAMRLLTDIGIRALSPAVNDPTTAVQALDRIDDLLRRVARRQLTIGTVRDAEGRVLFHMRTPTWDEFLEVGITEFRQYGETSSQVLRRLRALLEGLLAHAPEVRWESIRKQLVLLDASVARGFPDDAEQRLVAIPDVNGLGGAVRTDRRQADGGPLTLDRSEISG